MIGVECPNGFKMNVHINEYFFVFYKIFFLVKAMNFYAWIFSKAACVKI